MHNHKVFLVDDEPMVRIGIKKVLDDLDGNWQFIGEATNGNQALSLIKKLQPDLVISDIRMPGMSGLQLLEEIKQLYPEIVVILLTGYPDFEYAQQALRYGAFDYILKPTQAENIIIVLNRVEKKVLKTKQAKKQIQDLQNSLNTYNIWITEKILRNLLYGGSIGNFDLTHSNYLKKNMAIRVITLMQKKEVPLGQRLNILERLTNNLFPKEINYLIIPDGQDEILILIICSNDSNIIQWDSFENTLDLLQKKCEQQYDFPWKAGVGSVLPLFDSASLAYKQSKLAVHYSKGEHSIIHYNQISNYNIDSAVVPIELEFSLLNEIKIGRKEDLDKTLERVLSYFNYMTFQEIIDYANDLLRKIKSSLLVEYEPLSLSFHTHLDVKNWLTEQITLCFNKVHESEKKEISFIVKRAIAVIHKKYCNDLTLKNVAGELCINSSYLSVLFKKETGETFSDFLTNYRYIKAVELLENPKLKIYEIAKQVGYVNGRHFSQMFKRNSGMTPKQYRNRIEINH